MRRTIGQVQGHRTSVLFMLMQIERDGIMTDNLYGLISELTMNKCHYDFDQHDDRYDQGSVRVEGIFHVNFVIWMNMLHFFLLFCLITSLVLWLH